MRNLFKHWDNLKGELSDKYVMLFLDYDGTLAQIAETPEKAVIDNKTRNLLIKFSKIHRCKLIIVSGRDLKDIKARIGIRNIIYAGNHGFQIEGPDIKFETLVSCTYKESLEKIGRYLKKKIPHIKGAIIEDKELSLSLHYRMVKRETVPLVKAIFLEAVNCFAKKDDIRVEQGKKLFEVRPAMNWDKGKAVLWILDKLRKSMKSKNIMPVYIGDDITDEDAFKVLRKKGICIFVGRANKKSYAEYYLQSPQEVKNFLIRLKEILK